MDEAKVQVIKQWPLPKTHKQLLRFLGVANYYRQFVKNFSMITRPLDRIRKSNGPLDWSDEMKKAFEELTFKICERVRLSYPQDGAP